MSYYTHAVFFSNLLVILASQYTSLFSIDHYLCLSLPHDFYASNFSPLLNLRIQS
jgi:hypothetical protein